MADGRGARAREVVRRAYRKGVYRQHLLERYDRQTHQQLPPKRPLRDGLEVALLGPGEFDVVEGTNPYLTTQEFDYMRSHDTTCVVVRDGERIVASRWHIRGDAFIPELQRVVKGSPNEIYGCRVYVDDAYRGLSLAGHMSAAFRAATQGPDVVSWGLVYPWNTASVTAFEQIGARCTGEYWTRWIAGVKVPGERRFPPRPPRIVTGADLTG